MPSITRRPPVPSGGRELIESRILAATEALLADGAGFTELGVGRIADRAGVSRSTFYVHFRDKTDLIVRMGRQLERELFELHVRWAQEGAGDGAAELAHVIRQTLVFYREHRPLLLAMAEVTSYDADVRRAWRAELERFAEATARRLADDQRAGLVDPALDPPTAAWVLICGCERVLLAQITDGDPSTDDAVAHELAMAQWYGTYRRGSVGGG